MKTTTRLSFMMFVEWLIWGAWFVLLWLWLSKSSSSAGEISWSYACITIAAILSPTLVGSITDRFFSAQKVLAVLMFAGAVLVHFAAQQTTFVGFFPLPLAYSLTYMPTIALTNSIAFTNVPDVERDFPHTRVAGTVGWIASGLAYGFLPQVLGYTGISPTNIPLLITAGSSVLFDVLAFFLPGTPPRGAGKMDIKVMLDLGALILLRNKDFLIFFFCSFLFAIPLTFYYIFANGYLTEVGMKNATNRMTLSQFSEIFFMLVSSFFIKHFGIREVLLLGLVAAVIRYGFFIYGSADEYFTYVLLFLSILLHGVSYDFYYVTAYIYVDRKVPVYIRTAVQGLVAFCCRGFDSLLGYRLGGVMMEKMFAYQEPVNGLTFNWTGMWTFGAVMITIIAILLVVLFRESDNEITAIKVDDRDATLTQGEVR